MKSTAVHKPFYALPNYLYGFLRFCPFTLSPYEREVFATFERNRQSGQNVRMLYNLTGSLVDDDFINALVHYNHWIDYLRGGIPMHIAVLASSRSYGEEFGKHLFGKVMVYTPRNLISGVGRTFDMVFILDAHTFRRCRPDMYHYTHYHRALHFFGYARFLFIFGEYSSRGRLCNSFHAHYRHALAVQKKAPEVHSVFPRSAPVAHPAAGVPLPVNYTIPELRHRPELWPDDGDTEIVLGYTIGLPPQTRHTAPTPAAGAVHSPTASSPPLAIA